VIDVDRLTTYEVDAKFAELICADPQWLHDEFSALVAANFSAPPAWPRPPAPPTFPPGDHSRGTPPGQPALPDQSGLAQVRLRPRWRGPGHQRSPPLWGRLALPSPGRQRTGLGTLTDLADHRL